MQIRAAVRERFGEPLVAQDVELDGGLGVGSPISLRMTLDDLNRAFDLMHHQDGIRSVIQYA